MDGSPPKANRKVRFSLPEPTVPAVPSTTPVQKQRMSHGTVQYVNGTLISHQVQQTHPPGASHGSGQSRAHQSLQVTPTPTSLSSSGPGCTFKPKELNNKIVLHLRPSVSSLDQGGGVDLPSPKAQPPGASIDGGKASSRQKPFAQKPTHGVPAGSGGGRSLKSLPQINQKFPSSEDVNNNVGATMGGGTNRQKSSDDLSSLGMWNHPAVVKKPTIILRTISGGGIGQKSLTGRARSKSGLGKLPASGGGGAGGSSYGGRTGSKSLISPHLQPMEGGGVLIRVQENCTAGKCTSETNGGDTTGRAGATRSDEINVSSIIRPGGAATNSSTTTATASTTPTTTTASSRSYGKANQFLAVPEYSDRYEGMETVVSATLPDDEEEEEDEEDDFEESEQDRTGGGDERQRTAGRSNNGSASDDNGEPKANGSGVGDGDDASFRCTRDTNLSRDRNTAQFWDFVERWRTNRALKKLENANHHPHHQHRLEASNGGVGGVGGVGGSMSASIAPVPIGGSIKSDAKSPTLSSRIRALRMSLEQVPTVTTLLRASRDANEYLLKEVFRDILENGISKENLNSTDRSGRTAISYICSTNLTNFLELFLQLPGIDVNKPDNEGNTPLHFAAQAGKCAYTIRLLHANESLRAILRHGLSDVVNMLITKCRSLIIDPKNNLGFTPLMKAALQGRTRCAKLLLFAGASPVETDAGRGFRAEQWARFCGRHTCAETIEQCARARLLDKSTPCGRWSHDINLPVDKNALKARSCSITPQPTQNGFRSKFRKVFPFHFNSSKEKPTGKEGEENYTKDLVNYLKSATLCVSGPALSANRKIIQSLIRPLEVPKLEVTYANNNALIKKYEAAAENGTTDAVRRDSVEGTTESRNASPAHSPVPARAKVRN